MRRNFRPERKDRTHGPLALRFEQHGCSVLTLPASVPGLPDLLVGCARANHLVELKDPESRYGRAGLSVAQQEFADTWRGEPVAVASTGADVDALVARWRAAVALDRASDPRMARKP